MAAASSCACWKTSLTPAGMTGPRCGGTSRPRPEVGRPEVGRRTGTGPGAPGPSLPAAAAGLRAGPRRPRRRGLDHRRLGPRGLAGPVPGPARPQPLAAGVQRRCRGAAVLRRPDAGPAARHVGRPGRTVRDRVLRPGHAHRLGAGRAERHRLRPVRRAVLACLIGARAVGARVAERAPGSDVGQPGPVGEPRAALGAGQLHARQAAARRIRGPVHHREQEPDDDQGLAAHGGAAERSRRVRRGTPASRRPATP